MADPKRERRVTSTHGYHHEHNFVIRLIPYQEKL